MRWLLRGAVGLAIAIALLLGFVKWRYGGGAPYPGVAGLAPAATDAGGAATAIATLDFPPGNVAVSADGRVFFNHHPFAQSQRFSKATMFELVDGKPKPWPDEASQSRWQGVFGMTVDRQGRLWLVEPAGLDHESTRLSAFEISSGRRVFEHRFPKGELPFAQDLRVTPDGRTVILADTGLFKFTDPGLVVFDIASKSQRTRLAKHPSTRPQDWVMRTPFGPHRLAYGLVTFAVGVDGIEIDGAGQWLYYAAMTHGTLYRVPLAALLDPKVDEAALAAQVETIGAKPMSDGITLDREGRLVVTDVENGGLVRIDPAANGAGRARTLVKRPEVIWADGVVAAPDGALLFTDSAIPAYLDPLARPPSAERLRAGRPYRIWRVAPTP